MWGGASCKLLETKEKIKRKKRNELLLFYITYLTLFRNCVEKTVKNEKKQGKKCKNAVKKEKTRFYAFYANKMLYCIENGVKCMHFSKG